MLYTSLNHLSTLIVFVQTGAYVVRVASELPCSRVMTMILNSRSSCLSLLSAEVTGMCNPTSGGVCGSRD